MKRIGSMMIVALFVMAPLTACSSGDGTICNDDILEGGEVCDLSNLGGESCATQGFTGGSLTCNTSCDGFNVSQCTTCGNGMAEGMEDCDGADLGGGSCATQGFSGGTLACTAACTYDTNGCSADAICGNDSVEGTEVCDGADLGGASCTTQGFDGGTLGCNTTCTGYDTSACTGGSLQCIDLSTLDYINFPPCNTNDPVTCLCEGCVDDGVCFDSENSLADDCICPDCASDSFCASNCNNDGICNPWEESCACADCQGHSLCP